MAKDKLAPCIYYKCKGECSKNREASHKGYCQKCNKYKPRKGFVAPENKKRKAKYERTD